MAKLCNEKKDLVFELLLYKNLEDPTWINYEIIMSLVKHNKKPIIKLKEFTERYFEACYEPEVPKIYKLIKQVIYGDKSYVFFEPIDEKDFQLEFYKKNGDLYINIFSDYFTLFSDYNWESSSLIGVKMKVLEEDVLNFINELVEEYEMIKK